MRQCTFGGVSPQRVVSVRDPYSFVRSMYIYTWSCEYSDWCSRGYQPWMEFGEFVKNSLEPGAHATQSASVERACGHPCKYDHLLRTEHLTADWTALMRQTGRQVWQLPRSNPSKNGPMGPPPRTVFTREVTDIIERVEAPIFEQFGYRKREPPFELS